MNTLALLALSYVLVPGASNVMSSSIDLERALSIRYQYGSHFLWVERGGYEYLIRDQATLDRIDQLFDPSRAIGREMERLHARIRPIELREEELDRQADAISDDENRTARDEARLRDLHRELRDVEARLREYERQEDELDRKRDRLDNEAEEKMAAIVDDGIRRGIAHLVYAVGHRAVRH